jgi:ABC-type phosphate transport system permease subunit
MKHSIRLIVAVIALVLLALPLAAVGAQDTTRAITRTEADVNSSYRVTNPARRAVTNVVVDLQPGQVAISATLTYRRATYQTVAVYVPSVENGRIYWEVTSVTANGQPASQDLINQLNAAISSSWRNYIRNQAGTGRVQSLVITDSDYTITVGR